MTRSASPIGRSLNKSPAKSTRCRRTDHSYGFALSRSRFAPVCADSVASQRFYCWRSHPSSARRGIRSLAIHSHLDRPPLQLEHHYFPPSPSGRGQGEVSGFAIDLRPTLFSSQSCGFLQIIEPYHPMRKEIQ